VSPRQSQRSSTDRAPVNNVRLSYADALQRYRRQRHNRVWWKQHFATIVLVGGGYYYWDAGYWFPAFGYDPVYEYYDYDGPIYTYGNLLPDQVILNVQRALQEEGYYGGALTGALTSATRQAIAAYQQDAGLFVTGVVDAPTVAALGLE
jgi:Putative peptidoglycan binding domain